MLTSSDIYHNKLNCQKTYFSCNNIVKNHGKEEQHAKTGLRKFNLDLFNAASTNRKENFYVDNINIKLNQPELSRLKVNLDTINTPSNFYSKINNSSNSINVAEINTASNKSSIKQLIYTRVSESKLALNTKIENQLVLDNTNIISIKNNRTTSKCNLFNPCLAENDEYKAQQISQKEDLISNYQDLTKTNMQLHSKIINEQDMSSTRSNEDLAYENLTYLSLDEDDIDNSKLGQNTQTKQTTTKTAILGQEILKKTTIKSIKRKDKLKKNSNFEMMTTNKSLAKSMPDLTAQSKQEPIEQKSQELICSNEYDKILRKQFRSQALSRSMRRAKCVYYRNIRSKSLEDLTSEERASYLVKAAANLEKLRSRAISNLSINSCSSTNSNAVSITSSYIRDLSDWSPEFSSYESDESSDDLQLDNFDWDANLSLSQLELNDFESDESSSSENEENYEIVLDKNKIINNNNLGIRDELNEYNPISQKTKIEYIEKMMNEIMLKMINVLHIDLSCIKNVESYELIKNIKYTRMRSEDIEYGNSCSICCLEYELDDEVATVNCNHTFHKICLNFWLAKVNSCPACCCQNVKIISHRETLL